MNHKEKMRETMKILRTEILDCLDYAAIGAKLHQDPRTVRNHVEILHELGLINLSVPREDTPGDWCCPACGRADRRPTKEERAELYKAFMKRLEEGRQ